MITKHHLVLSYTECHELVRALRLIIQEDESCGVNIDAVARLAKSRALKKLEKITGPNRLDALLKKSEIVIVGTGRSDD